VLLEMKAQVIAAARVGCCGNRSVTAVAMDAKACTGFVLCCQTRAMKLFGVDTALSFGLIRRSKGSGVKSWEMTALW
jgi:hypothetical protein